ncbi:PQQ-binding-like beta-propeller repeat protein [Ornithinimicrobium cavernae]|uniref:PQQ-binding-like beta-propeller repeat protein n=1 Tax=Ornithinimicrobium cavernae TaxID=2666047 RepID=UPI0012B16F85|nr:PQQ-binding-like beta-propeller repeat protein [Ornithinimicrobium cavernae]
MPRPGLTTVLLLALLTSACAGASSDESARGTAATSVTPSGHDDEGRAADTAPAADSVSSTRGDSTGATEPSDGASTPPAVDRSALAGVRWRNDELRPVTAPVLVDETLVLYTLDGRRLEITGVDSTDGRVLWSRAATRSVRPPGQDLSVEEVEGGVVHLAPAPHPDAPVEAATAHVIVRDPRTGEAVRTLAEPLSHADLPTACPHDAEEVCLTVQVDGVWTVQALTPEGALHDPPATGVPGWTSIGPLGLSRQAMDGTRIGRVVDGALLWEADTTELFAAGHSTDTGWSFQSFEDDTILVGTVGTALSSPRTRTSWDLTAGRSVGLDVSTGTRLWEAPATSTFCDIDVSGGPEDPLLVCAWHDGEVVTDHGEATYRDLDVDLVRLDPASGEVLWRVPLGATVDGSEPGAPELQLVGPGEVAVETADGAVVIDTARGTARPATTADARWVEDRTPVEVELPGARDDDRISTWGRWRREGGAGATGDGSAAAPGEQVAWPLPLTIGLALENGAVRVVADPEGLTAYSAP